MLFCGRYLEVLLYDASIPMLRVSMAEADRFPEQAAQYFDMVFTQVHARPSAYLRATFGMDQSAERFDGEALAPDFDLNPIRKAVADLMDRLPTP